jgi:hypothetical protein
LPKKGFCVITFKDDLIARAKSAFEKKRAELPVGTSFSKFVADMISNQLDSMEVKNSAIAPWEMEYTKGSTSVCDDGPGDKRALSVY